MKDTTIVNLQMENLRILSKARKKYQDLTVTENGKVIADGKEHTNLNRLLRTRFNLQKEILLDMLSDIKLTEKDTDKNYVTLANRKYKIQITELGINVTEKGKTTTLYNDSEIGKYFNIGA